MKATICKEPGCAGQVFRKARCRAHYKALCKAQWLARPGIDHGHRGRPLGSRMSQDALIRPRIAPPANPEKSLSTRLEPTSHQLIQPAAQRNRPEGVQAPAFGRTRPIDKHPNGEQCAYPKPPADMLRAARLTRIRRDGPKPSDSPADIAESGWEPPPIEQVLQRRFA